MFPSQDRSLVSHQENLRIRHRSINSLNQKKQDPAGFLCRFPDYHRTEGGKQGLGIDKKFCVEQSQGLGNTPEIKGFRFRKTSCCCLVSVLLAGPEIISDRHNWRLNSSSAASTAAWSSLEKVLLVTRRRPLHSACRKWNTVFPDAAWPCLRWFAARTPYPFSCSLVNPESEWVTRHLWHFMDSYVSSVGCLFMLGQQGVQSAAV